MVATIESWEAKFGSNDQFTASNRIGFDYELNVAYPAQIKTAKIIKNKRDIVCLQLDLVLQNADRSENIGSAREWLDLPKQAADEKFDIAMVRKITLRRRDDLQRLVSLSDAKFCIFADRITDGGKVKYLDRNGQAMNQGDLRAREKEVNEAVMELADEWHDQVGETVADLEGAEFWIVKAPNPKHANYPYTNIFSAKPTKFPLVGETLDESF